MLHRMSHNFCDTMREVILYEKNETKIWHQNNLHLNLNKKRRIFISALSLQENRKFEYLLES